MHIPSIFTIEDKSEEKEEVNELDELIPSTRSDLDEIKRAEKIPETILTAEETVKEKSTSENSINDDKSLPVEIPVDIPVKNNTAQKKTENVVTEELVRDITEDDKESRSEKSEETRETSAVEVVDTADYDQDGDLDIFIVGSFSEENNSQTWSRLLQNTNSGNFIDVTVNTGIEQNLNHDIILNDIGFLDLQQDFGDRLSASWGDFNNDSFPDLFLGNSNQSQLYQNNTDGSFTNITNQSGLAIDCDTCSNHSIRGSTNISHLIQDRVSPCLHPRDKVYSSVRP
jgi:hypothetical protein